MIYKYQTKQITFIGVIKWQRKFTLLKHSVLWFLKSDWKRRRLSYKHTRATVYIGTIICEHLSVGEVISGIIVEKLKELGIFHLIGPICFDTTASNTGWARGNINTTNDTYTTKDLKFILQLGNLLK